MENHISHSLVLDVEHLIDYSHDATVSKVLSKGKNGNITLFAFDEGQNLSEHTSPFDATVFVLDGLCKITINGAENALKKGEMIIMPAHIPHALEATEAFKMMLIMIKNE